MHDVWWIMWMYGEKSLDFLWISLKILGDLVKMGGFILKNEGFGDKFWGLKHQDDGVFIN